MASVLQKPQTPLSIAKSTRQEHLPRLNQNCDVGITKVRTPLVAGGRLKESFPRFLLLNQKRLRRVRKEAVIEPIQLGKARSPLELITKTSTRWKSTVGCYLPQERVVATEAATLPVSQSVRFANLVTERAALAPNHLPSTVFSIDPKSDRFCMTCGTNNSFVLTLPNLELPRIRFCMLSR